ncbi:MAG: YcgL domain-containing protein [Gammaproteobacteria bacterium]|nr:YcgL domain-containing protein [Gammaproteobacteria bacterium]
MICYIYRSPKKSETYLYVTKKDEFSSVPEQLLKTFGKPEFSMTVNLAKRNCLARENIAIVREQLTNDGYFLQMPPLESDNKNYLSPEN